MMPRTLRSAALSIGATALAAALTIGSVSPAAAASENRGAGADRCPPGLAQAMQEMMDSSAMQQLMQNAKDNPALAQAMRQMMNSPGMAQLMRDCGMRPM
ncbi:hypothetical protein SAMN05216266_14018 [Amycolatopsis marina]|uniref:Hemophore-related protein, Rv0203/Rv1174c family n=3 Tax=Pseudonocardiaceae TaxID=2070 RepID=A0A1I1CN36_9PSEU|nr:MULTISPECIES: hypothetical protein [Pseudonocardiaceae]MBE1579457.1 hypothetical protein [Amycolatopsis roodepoortensis]TKG68295.1 hypothetical protein FCN18_21240 [Prauserella endophytica]TWE14913.1 hypothetical protein FHX69_7079 [Prauserella muralis]SDU63240.1 hypothetical protein SAMN04489733_7359 [Amycolatopsis keratiniphila]SFB64115.1 hypothetical protein SAMN05216266_14018 [Amycolatopsis marina]